MSTVYIWEAANLFCGDHDPTASKHLVIQELKLPTLQEQFQDHAPGGGPVAVEFSTNINKLEPTFKFVGEDNGMLSQFGLGSRLRQIYTAYSVIVDRRTSRRIERKSIMEARLGKIETDAFKRGEVAATDYALNELMHYEVWFDGREKLYWDFFENDWRIDGVSQNAEANRILRIR